MTGVQTCALPISRILKVYVTGRGGVGVSTSIEKRGVCGRREGGVIDEIRTVKVAGGPQFNPIQSVVH